MLTNANPQNPETPGGMPAPGGMDPTQDTQQAQPEPKTIRDYVALARQQGQVPTFTNIDGAQGFDIRQDPGYIQTYQEQAISEGPDNEYEAEPWDQRVRKDPYLRAQQSLPRFLNEMWAMRFPDQEPGTLDPNSPEAKEWQGQVEAVTGHLLKKYSKQHDWWLKQKDRDKAKRTKDEQYWQKFYAQQDAAMRTPTHPDGNIMSPSEFVDKQMGIADERKMKEEIGAEEAKDGPTGTYDDLEGDEIMEIVRANPDLQAAIKARIVEALSQQEGRQITDPEFLAMRTDPDKMQMFQQQAKTAIDSFGEDIYSLSAGGKKQASKDQAMAMPSN